MYKYETEKSKLFTEEGQITFLKVRDHTHRLVAEAGAVRMDKAVNVACGDAWLLLACVDRMVELGELEEVTTQGFGQHRVFVSGRGN